MLLPDEGASLSCYLIDFVAERHEVLHQRENLNAGYLVVLEYP